MAESKDLIKTKEGYKCPHCHAKIEYVIDLVKGYGKTQLSDSSFLLSEITECYEQECPVCGGLVTTY